ncbi:MAG: GLUG motif-containing protein, partial [Planctomycetota bacterium]
MRQLVVIALLTALCGSLCAAGGDMGLATDPNTNGSETYPWLIEDIDDFDTFADPNNAATYWASGVHTKLMTNIDLSGRTYTTAVIAPDSVDAFWGIFKGNSKTVVNLTINGTYYCGLFGYLNDSAEVRNLGVKGVSVAGSGMLGGLCGVNNYGMIDNCYTSGEVSGGGDSEYIGGLCGINHSGTINNCHTTGEVFISGNDSDLIGGLCGVNDGGLISNCNAIFTVSV